MGWNLRELIAEHGVPGAQVAVLAGGEIRDEAAGVLNLRTGVETTSDSVFKVGSITKIWTATLVQQLVQDGVLELDRPVREYLPGFRLSDPAATATLTARHLLTHTSGIDANHDVDPGRNADAIEKFIAGLAEAEHLFEPGRVLSYSNSGYVLLGRLVEVLRGKLFHEVLRERLVHPLGLTTVATSADEAILHRAAVGHVETDGVLEPTKTWSVRHFSSPSGSQLAMSARDLLELVRWQLSDPALAVLREPHVATVPDFGGGVLSWGLGWMRYRDGVVGHTGVSRGQKAFLRVAPSAGVAVAVLTNSPRAEPLAYRLFGGVLKELAGVETTPLPVPPAEPAPLDADRIRGTYRTTRYDRVLTVENGRGFLTRHTAAGPANRIEVVRLDDTAVIAVEPTVDGHEVLSFVGADEDGRAQFLHNGVAAYRVS